MHTKLRPPAEPSWAVDGATLKTEGVTRHGRGRREMGVTTGSGHWYQAGWGLVPIAWAHVEDQTGMHRDESSFSADLKMTTTAMIEAHAGRWNLENTFQEMRCLLGLESTRDWCRRTVLRVAPCLFGLYSLEAFLYQSLPESNRVGRVGCPGKQGVTFSDAITCVLRWLWREWVLPRAGGGTTSDHLPEPLQEALFYALTLAAWFVAFASIELSLTDEPRAVGLFGNFSPD